MKLLLIQEYADLWETENILNDMLEDCEIVYERHYNKAFQHEEEGIDFILLSYGSAYTYRIGELKKLRKCFSDAKIFFLTDSFCKYNKRILRAADGILKKPLQESAIRAYFLDEWEAEDYFEDITEDEMLEKDVEYEMLEGDTEHEKLKGNTERKTLKEEIIRKKPYNLNRIAIVFFCISLLCMLAYAGDRLDRYRDRMAIHSMQQELIKEREQAKQVSVGTQKLQEEETVEEETKTQRGFLPGMQALYDRNPDVVGWLSISGTVIDYPVMQTLEEEEYYIRRDFDKKDNRNGSLFVDTDSCVGNGEDEKPSTNILIYGHTMKSGEMFGKLELYEKEEYGKKHSVIQFDSLYENRVYQLISVFYSKIYNTDEQVFKYYQFFQADNQEEFQYWYENIKALSLYDTGLEAEFGDEFITLSCCSNHTKNGRFVVVAKRVY